MKKQEKYRILALDVATHTGWAITNQIYGVWDLTPKRDESKGMKYIRFKAKLNEVINLEKINLIVFERAAGFHRGALIVEAELHGILKLYLEENKLEYRAYSAGEIKKYATGKGNSNKEAMIAAARARFGYPGDSDDEADAICLLNLANSDIGNKGAK